jgi:hypothetical protein
MNQSEKKELLCRCVLRLAGQALASEPCASVVLHMLASAIELGTVDELAEAVIQHETRQLVKFRYEVDDLLRDCLAAKRQSRRF